MERVIDLISHLCETLIQECGCSLENEFIELIWLKKHLMKSTYQKIFFCSGSCAYNPLIWDYHRALYIWIHILIHTHSWLSHVQCVLDIMDCVWRLWRRKTAFPHRIFQISPNLGWNKFKNFLSYIYFRSKSLDLILLSDISNLKLNLKLWWKKKYLKGNLITL